MASACAVAAAFLAGCGGLERSAMSPTDSVLHAVRVAEDARDPSTDAMAPIVRALSHAEPRVRATAVRAVGRFERPELIAVLAPVLADADRGVRAEAVNAVGQAARQDGADAAYVALTERLPLESDPVVRGVYGQTLGGLAYATAEAHRAAESVLASLLAEPGPDGGPQRTTTTLALVRGFEALARRGRALRPLDPATTDALATLATDRALRGDEPPDGPGPARVRRTALQAWVAGTEAPDPAVLAAALEDPDEGVRLVAARGMAALDRPGGLLERGLTDPDFRVRWEAVRVAGGQAGGQGCGALLAAAGDTDDHVALLALDLLARPCPDGAAQRTALTRAATTATGDPARWHRQAHAVAALAALAPGEAGAAVADLATHPTRFARAWAARAATSTGDVALLRGLAGDPDHNVREVAIRGLYEHVGREADATVISQLDARDPQLVMTASRLLEGSEDPAAVPALVGALERFTATGRETTRDVRVALLERIGTLGGADLTPRLEAYLVDYDPTVAALAATTLAGLDGRAREARPEPLPHTPVPAPAELALLAASSVVLEMEGGGEIEIQLLPDLAPTNAARFARLASEGYYDGLTFHRVAPNFVIQGGSPGANEYWGDGPYSRDEVALLGHWRGTVGLSTRGRDTGDAQIFVNLVDNLRLDHDYTIFGVVTRGMDVVDRVLEGDVITRAGVVPRGS